MSVLRRLRENVVKSGHVVGLGSSLVLNPLGESVLIGYVDNSGLFLAFRLPFCSRRGLYAFF